MSALSTAAFLASGFGLGCAATAAQQTLAPSLSVPAQVSLGGALFALGAWTLNFVAGQVRVRDDHIRDSNALMMESAKGLGQTAEAMRSIAAEQAESRRFAERAERSFGARLDGLEGKVERVESAVARIVSEWGGPK